MKTISLVLFCLLSFALAPLASAEPGPHAWATRPIADDCATCGKHIYFGERCLTCHIAAKRQQLAHPCETCATSILVGNQCASCALSKLKGKLAHDCADCGTTVHVGRRCNACAANHMQGQLAKLLSQTGAAGSQLGQNTARRLQDLKSFLPGAPDHELTLTETTARAKEVKAVEAAQGSWLKRAQTWADEFDPKQPLPMGAGSVVAIRRRANMALGVALEVAESVETTKRELAQAGMHKALQLPVKSEAGWTSLGDLATAKLLIAAPELAGTDLIKNPDAVLAALVIADPMAFLMDFELVPAADGKALSIVDALAEKSSGDPKTSLACLTLIEATRKLRRGEDVTRSVHDISRALQILLPTDTNDQ